MFERRQGYSISVGNMVSVSLPEMWRIVRTCLYHGGQLDGQRRNIPDTFPGIADLNPEQPVLFMLEKPDGTTVYEKYRLDGDDAWFEGEEAEPSP